MFTINNKTTSTVGPYNNQTIPSLGNLSVPDPDNMMSSDATLFADVLTRTVTISSGTVEMAEQSAIDFLRHRQLCIPSVINPITTQFELRDKTIKLANVSGAVQGDGTVTAYLQVPGIANPTGDTALDGRWISSGTAFFDVPTPGDIITSVRFVDHDNILGQGVDFVVGSYTDDDAPSGSQGWFIPPTKGEITAEAIGGYGFAPSGFYIMVTAKKGGGLITGTLYVNLEWGKTGS